VKHRVARVRLCELILVSQLSNGSAYPVDCVSTYLKYLRVEFHWFNRDGYYALS